jgi:hypothetical protein
MYVRFRVPPAGVCLGWLERLRAVLHWTPTEPRGDGGCPGGLRGGDGWGSAGSCGDCRKETGRSFAEGQQSAWQSARGIGAGTVDTQGFTGRTILVTLLGLASHRQWWILTWFLKLRNTYQSWGCQRHKMARSPVPMPQYHQLLFLPGFVSRASVFFPALVLELMFSTRLWF